MVMINSNVDLILTFGDYGMLLESISGVIGVMYHIYSFIILDICIISCR